MIRGLQRRTAASIEPGRSQPSPRPSPKTPKRADFEVTLPAVISERDGCQALARVFEQRGYALARNIPLELGEHRFTADGWDAAARVGFEYLTHEAGDHLDLPPAVLARLRELIAAGELYLLLIDQHEADTLDDLSWAAHRFLDEVERRKGARSEGR